MEFFKKALVGISIGILLLLATVSGIYSLEKNSKTQIYTIKETADITMDSRQMVYQPMLLAPYKTMDTFLSNEESPDFKFTGIGMYWEEQAAEGTNIILEVRFKEGDKWSQWLEMEGEPDSFASSADGNTKKFATAVSDEANAAQYRFTMYGDGIKTPTIKGVELTFLKTGKSINTQATPNPQFYASSVASNSTYLALTATSQSGVISRSQWGAEESYRYLSDNTVDPVLIEIDDAYYQQFKDELQYSSVIKQDSDGNKYKWPLQYPEKVKKFVIHHTATTANMDDPAQAIRDIYYYHAITRGWGDIGYNYIVDKEGKVYEGRYGGEGVIGAHAGVGNNGSIGIAVLGNYEEEEVPEKIIKNLGKFISKKSKIHGISPEGNAMFRGQTMPNVFGHKDIMSTACPGAYLYEVLPILRSIGENYQEKQKEKFVKDYDYQDLSEIYYLELKPKEIVDLTIKMENIGKVDWNDDTYIVIDKNPDFKDVISFPGTGDVIKASMKESSVKPGETATFNLKVKGDSKGEIVYMSIAPVMNGTKKAKDYIVIPVSVQQVDYKYEFIEAKYPTEAMEKGEVFEGYVKLKNTGNVTWRKSGETTITLGTDHLKDRESAFIAASPTRMGYLQEEEVKPGETGTFTLKLQAPQDSGYYKEYFTPVVEGVTWLSDSGMYFETTVFGGLYEAEEISISASGEWIRGKKYMVIAKIRNLGQATWTKDNMTIDILKELDLKIEDAKLTNAEVKPGEVATITFIAKVADDEDLDRKPILIRPKVDGQKLFQKPLRLYYKVVTDGSITLDPNLGKNLSEPSENNDPEVKDLSGKEGDIRVKLTYEGSPTISADSAFDIYNRTSILTSLDAGETVEIKLVDDKLEVKTANETFTKVGPIRFIPKNGGVSKVENKSGYNEYRGVLEVQIVDGKLTLINELPLEDYLNGLAEEPNTEEFEKIKAIMVAARSYAMFYMEKAEKFPGKPYNLDDDPATSQKYLGYSFEKNAPNVVAAVKATEGQVVYYNDELVKTPYFSRSDGVATKSAMEVWNWDAPYLISVSDTYCDGDAFWGHGVGLSGCGAKGMAEAGFNYVEILTHYYTDVEIVDLY